MSARSSVTRQTSQESDANNNFGSTTLINGQNTAFVIPTLPQGATASSLPPNSYNPQTAVTMQHQMQRMAAVPNGGNPSGAYGPRPPRPVAMSTSAPPSSFVVNPPHMPVLQVQPGAILTRHPTLTGNAQHQIFTLTLPSGQAAAQGGMVPAQNVPSNYYQPSNQYPPGDPMTSPPPGSSVPTFFPGAPGYFPIGGPQPVFGYPYGTTAAYMNGPGAAFGYGQGPQQQGAMGPYMAPEYGTPVAGPPTSQASVPASVAMSAPMGPMQAPTQTYQSYQSPQQQQQPTQTPPQPQPGRQRKILNIVDPDTNENVMDKVIKEKEEEQEKQHQQYLQGGVWKPPPGQQQPHMYMENADRRPSRSASATPQSISGMQGGMDTTQTDTTVTDFYTAMAQAAAAASGQQTDDPVILPPDPTDHVETSGSRLEFGVDENTMSASTSKKPEHIHGKSEIEFGWSPSSDVPQEPVAVDEPDNQRMDVDPHQLPVEPSVVENKDPKSKSKSPTPVVQVSDYERPESGSRQLNDDDYPQLQKPDAQDENAETASIAAASMQVQFDAQSTAGDSMFDMSSVQDGSSRLDDSVLDLSSTASVDGDRPTETSPTESQSELATLKAELDRFADPEGKRRYSREFMCAASKLPASKTRPPFDTKKWSADNLSDVFDLRKGNQNKANNAMFRSTMPTSGSSTDFFNTSWMKPSPSGPPGGGKQYFGRFSDKNADRGDRREGRGGRGHGGRGSTMKQQIVIAAPVVDVELRTTENAWKPGRKAETKAEDPEKAETNRLLKEVRGILNKITPQTFAELSEEFLKLEPRMNTADRASGVVDIVFQKAVEEPKFVSMYSNLYDRMTKLQLQRQQQQQQAAGGAGAVTKTSSMALNKDTNFRYILLTKCQTAFDKDTKFEAMKKEKEEAIAKEESPEIKKQLQDDLEELLQKERRQTLGNMTFIGELYHRSMLTAKIMHSCVIGLLKNATDDEESLESLCKLLTTIGKKLESDKKSEFYNKIEEYYAQLEMLTQKPKLASRYRFMILDLLDLRKNNWEPRRKGDGPKTIDQVHQEAMVEKLNQQIALEQHELNKQHHLGLQEDSPTRGSRRGRRPELPNRGSYGTPDRHDFDGRGARASMGREQGRQQGPQAHVQESVSKFKQPALSQHLDPSSMKLGPQRNVWSKGAGAGVSTPTPSPGGSATLPRSTNQDPSFRSMNRFEHLSMADERPTTGSASSSRESSQTRYDEKRKALDNVRQFVGTPSSMAKPSERQDGSTISQPPEAGEGASAEMDEEKLKRYGYEMIDELVDTNDFKEAIRLIHDRRALADQILAFALYHVMEKGEKHRKLLGQLIARWHAADGQSADISKGFALFVQNATGDDLAQDVPLLWAYTGQVLATALMESESLSTSGKRLMLSEFRDAFRNAGDKVGAELLAQTLLAIKRKPSSDEQVAIQYRSVADRLSSDFELSNGQVAAALRKRELDFLLSGDTGGIGAPSDPIPPASSVALPPYGLASQAPPGGGLLRMASVHSDLEADKAELERLVKTGGKLAVDRLIPFLQSTKRFEDESDERSLTFLGALIQSLCSKVIVVGELDDSSDVDAGELERFCQVLLPFVKSRRAFEMKTLDVLADIYHKCNCPKGLLVKILSSLQETGVIETEGFSEWWRLKENELPGMIRSSGEVKAFFAQFFDDATSDAGSESDQGE